MTITRPSSDGGDVRDDDDDDDDEVVVVPPRLLCMALSSPGWNIIWFVLRCRHHYFFGLSSDPAVLAGEYPPTESSRGVMIRGTYSTLTYIL